jgi:quinol monooxygenase YgiN
MRGASAIEGDGQLGHTGPMLIISGTVTFDPDDLQALLPAALTMVEESRKEDGCIEYEFAEVLGTPGVIRIWEIWESGEHLKAHGASAHMLDWREALGAVNPLGRGLNRYEGDFEISPLN